MDVSGECQDTICTVPHCDQNLYAKGICFAHYMQMYRKGTLSSIRKRNNNPPATCTVAGCDKPYTAKGMCMMHYQRHRRARTTN